MLEERTLLYPFLKMKFKTGIIISAQYAEKNGKLFPLI
jgi:hypothetical protein